MSEKAKRMISKTMKGKKKSKETRRKMSEVKNGKNNPFYGKHHSKETKRKMSKAQTARRNQLKAYMKLQ
ncbi:MAG: hypothetical protein EX285_03720 [Thaumarchaeota archaeon]|nr:hypothetical protein [Nitrososphaerota archaeon]